MPAYSKYKVEVLTGDQLRAGTDANVYLILHDVDGTASPRYKLDNFLHNDFERGNIDVFTLKIPTKSCVLGRLHKVEIWRDKYGLGPWWYLKGVNVIDVQRKHRSVFPFHKWIDEHVHYVVTEFDTCLPQFDDRGVQRQRELEKKRQHYELICHHPHLPPQSKELPQEETFGWEYKWDFVKRRSRLILRSTIVNLFSAKWKSVSQLKNVYKSMSLPVPAGATEWQDDLSFARQRTQGCSIGLIKLCTAIPDKFKVTDEMLSPFLEHLTISDAITRKRLFIIDLAIVQGMIRKDGYHICSPIALFFENEDQKLIPVAIQLEQDPGPENPVFLPSDPHYTWLMAKMWYNNADAMYHQSCTHIGFTHLLMEGVCVSTNRHLSQSHPIYKLLAPHFLYIIAINSRGLERLVSPGGWVDKTMASGVMGMFDLINRGTTSWRVDVEGTMPTHIAERGLIDALFDFPYRDDGLLVYDIIHRYVTKIVNHYYDSVDKIVGDWELQEWVKELIADKKDGGLGLKGVPGNGHFTSNDQLITLLSCIISTCSIGHASANFLQYDQYAFPPNYPSLLSGTPPKTKVALSETDILNALPGKSTTLDIMVVTKILSNRGTKSLSDFEVSYIFDPPAKQFVKEFSDELSQAAETIDQRNKTRHVEYMILNPKYIPNSISI